MIQKRKDKTAEKGGFCLMRKKRIANIVMVLIIAALAVGGGLWALSQRDALDSRVGSEYHIQELNDSVLTEPGQEKTCTITIRCDAALENLESLREEKLPYVPRNGVMLPETTVSFAEGDTVFSVLQRVCNASELPLEYSWTPLYDSYYIEGIGHLYEFDAGPESGWMYKVNGTFPNYGCSSYTLEGGEEIVWTYTCAGLGTDVGAAVMAK